MKIGKVIFVVFAVLVITASAFGGLALALNITAGAEEVTGDIIMGDIIINEIMYNPQGTDTHHEWLELYNNDTKAINITGWKFYEAGTNHGLTLEQGSMTIPVEGYAIIADNATMFLNEHPACACTVIDSVFSLSNTGEYIALKNATLVTIDDVTYNASWGADGNGRTLELNETEGWEESRVDGGTPCEENSVLWDREAPMVINATATPSTIAVNTVNTTLHVEVTDRDSNINNVTIDLSPIGKSSDMVMTLIGNYTMDELTWLQFEHETNASIAGTFNLPVNATDTYSNYNDTESIELTVIPLHTIVKVEQASQTVLPGQNFSVNITVEDVTDMATDGAILHFDPGAMQATGITGGVIDTSPVEAIDNVAGTVTFAYALATGSFSGNGTLATIEFTTDASAEGMFNLNLTDVELMRPDLSLISTEVFNGTVTLIPFNITIISPENRTYASKCVRLNFTVEPAGTVMNWIGYSLDGEANVTIASNTTVFDALGVTPPCDHNIVVYANDTHDIMAASNTVYFTLHPADIDGDCRVYVSDLLLLAQAYNSRPGDANWNLDADLNCDDRVYTADLLILAQNYNKVY